MSNEDIFTQLEKGIKDNVNIIRVHTAAGMLFAVLNLVASSEVFKKMYKSHEGELNSIMNSIVSSYMATLLTNAGSKQEREKWKLIIESNDMWRITKTSKDGKHFETLLKMNKGEA